MKTSPTICDITKYFKKQKTISQPPQPDLKWTNEEEEKDRYIQDFLAALPAELREEQQELLYRR